MNLGKSIIRLLIVLAFLPFLIAPVVAQWHTVSNPPALFPAESAPLYIAPSGPVVTNTTVVNGVTNFSLTMTPTNLFTVTNGLLAQQSSQTFTDWYMLATNWFKAGTNGVTNWLGVYQTGPTNATGGLQITNFLGVSSQQPTTSVATIPNLLAPGYYMPATNPSGGLVYGSNTWLRDVILTPTSPELFRWSWARGQDLVTNNAGTNFTVAWTQVYLPDLALFNYPGYIFSIINTNGSWVTNYDITSPGLTNQWLDGGSFNGQPTTQQWQYAYQAYSNVVLNVQQTQLWDLYHALLERQQVLLATPDVETWIPAPAQGDYAVAQRSPNSFYYHGGWRFQLPQRVLPPQGNLAAPNDFAYNVYETKHAVLAMAPLFINPAMADSNGNFTAFLGTPQTNQWFWTGTMWTNPVCFDADMPYWGSSSNIGSVVVADDGQYQFQRTGAGPAVELCQGLGLPIGVLTGTVQGLVTNFGWQAGQMTNYIASVTTNAPVTNTVYYGLYFNYTPTTIFAPDAPGMGHVNANTFQYINVWTAGLTTIASVVTNQRAIPFTTGIKLPTGTTVSDSVFSVVTAWKWCFETNYFTVWTKHLGHAVTNQSGATCRKIPNATFGRLAGTNITGITFNFFHSAWNNGSHADTLILNTNLDNPVNLLTNTTAVLTNYDIADDGGGSNRWHEINYGIGGLKPCLDSFVYSDLWLIPYTGDSGASNEWDVEDTVNTNNLGIVLVDTNCNQSYQDNGNFMAKSDSGFVLYPTAGPDLNLFPTAAKSFQWTPGTVNNYTQIMVVADSNAGTTTTMTGQAFWPGCDPVNFDQSTSYGDGCGITGTYELSVTFVFINSQQVWSNNCIALFDINTPLSNVAASVNNGCTVTWSSAGSITAEQGQRVSAALIFPEALTNVFSSLGSRDVYVHSAMPANIAGALNLNSNIVVGFQATNIDNVAGSGCSTPTTYYYAGYFGASDNTCLDSELSGSYTAFGIGLSPSTFGGCFIFSSDTPLTSPILGPPGFGMDLYFVACSGPLFPNYHSVTLMTQVHTYPTPSVERYTSDDCRQSVTNLNVPVFASVPYFDGSEVNLGLNQFWQSGYWQSPSNTVPVNFNRDITATNFVSPNVPWLGVTIPSDFSRGWAVDGARVVIRWNGTNGFKYHGSP